MKFVDYKCPNCGGSVKFEKGNSTGYCENCGATLHVETETTDKLFRAFDLISVNRFVTATDLLNDVLNNDVKNGQAYLGLLLCDTECTSPMDLANTKYQFANNPNYIRALDFLPENQKNELVALCNQNQINNSASNVAPSEAMKELSRLNGIVIAKGFTAVQLYYGSDFSTKDENVVIQFYHETTEHMEKMISLYSTLSDEQKNQIANFNTTEFEGAVDTYLQIKEIISSLSQNDSNTVDSNNSSDFESQSVEEILNNSDLSDEEKIEALSIDQGVDCIGLLLKKAYNLNWYFRYFLSEEDCNKIYGRDEWVTYIEEWDECLDMVMMENMLPKMDACSKLINEMLNKNPELEDEGRFILWKIAAYIWINKPYEFYEENSSSCNEYEELKNARKTYFELYKYIAKLYVLEEQYIETCGGNHAVDVKGQFERISKLKQSMYGRYSSFSERPYSFYENRSLGYRAMDEILTTELEYIENFINLDCEKSMLEYELGGLSLFNQSRKKEIKTRIAEIDKKIASDHAKIDLAVLENSSHNVTVALYNLTYEKDIVDKAKADFDATPFTAFVRRKELKEKYQALNEEYLAKKTSYEGQIKALTVEIEKIKKTIN